MFYSGCKKLIIKNNTDETISNLEISYDNLDKALMKFDVLSNNEKYINLVVGHILKPCSLILRYKENGEDKQKNIFNSLSSKDLSTLLVNVNKDSNDQYTFESINNYNMYD